MTRSASGAGTTPSSAARATSSEARAAGSIKALLACVIDYAGMFPPTSLELEPAVLNYARYRNEREAWMLGRFVCPTSRLIDLVRSLPQVSVPGRPLSVIALGRGDGRETGECIKNIRHDLESIRVFRQQAGKRAQVEVFETKLPDDLVGAQRVVKEIVRAAKVGMRPFCEIPVGANFLSRVGPMVQLIASNPDLGAKLRCGGADASAIPSSEYLAATMAACRDAHLRLKFTAGLHHPLRHHDEKLKAMMHGFINVFVAGVIARVGQRDVPGLARILDDEDPASFSFFDHGIAWQTTKAMTAQITAIRRDGLISFGSCSFNDPREDLKKLGWLP